MGHEPVQNAMAFNGYYRVIWTIYQQYDTKFSSHNTLANLPAF